MYRFLFLFCGISICCTCTLPVATTIAKEELDATFEAFLQEELEGRYLSNEGIAMCVLAPDLEINWSGTVGFDSKKKDRELEVQQPFRIASITKTYVATAILRLQEIGKLSVNDPIKSYISEEHLNLLIAGGYSPDSITLNHCLHHTSGLYDYAMGGRAYVETCLNNPKKRWSRTEQLQFAIETGTRTSNPGERYAYGDTGYILLGEIIERQVDSTLAYGLRSLLGYEKLGLEKTWLESVEAQPEGLLPMAHCYFQNKDALNWDPSTDLWGGGGIVSTTEEMAQYFQALFNHQIYTQQQTLDLMLEKPIYAASYNPTKNDRHKDYRKGLWEVTIYGEKAYMHSGLWGTHLLHLPKYNCSIAIKYVNGHGERLLKKTILVIKNLYESNQAS